MANLIEIGLMLTKSKGYYSKLVEAWIQGLEIGIDVCHDNIKTLREVMLALQYQYDTLQEISETTQKLYMCLMKLVGSTGEQPKMTVFYGYSDDYVFPTESDIITSQYNKLADVGSDYILDLNVVQQPKYVWIAQLSTEPMKTSWIDTVNPLNNGAIGSNEDLFGAGSIVGDYTVYFTEYKTVFANPIKIRK